MFEPGQCPVDILDNLQYKLSILTEWMDIDLEEEKQMFQVFCHYRAKVKIKSSKYIFIVPKVLDIQCLHSVQVFIRVKKNQQEWWRTPSSAEKPG